MKIATAGNCFAQHVGKHLKLNGFNVLDTEKSPNYLPKNKAQNFGYEIYSARYGNIYTSIQLLELTKSVFKLSNDPF